MTRRYYGISEIAHALAARPATVAQWYRRGKLPPPSDILAMGPVWTASRIDPWIHQMQVDLVAKDAQRAERRQRLAENTARIAGGFFAGVAEVSAAAEQARKRGELPPVGDASADNDTSSAAEE